MARRPRTPKSEFGPAWGGPLRPVGQAPKRASPPETTHAEAFYYVKQMNAATPMTVVLNDGEAMHGVIEWYDRACIKLNRDCLLYTSPSPRD